MLKQDFKELESEYNLEIDRILNEIKKQKAKRVLIQLPEGFKPYATLIQEKLEERLKSQDYSCQFFIWLDSCFGACDIPLETEKLGIELIIQFGHTKFE